MSPLVTITSKRQLTIPSKVFEKAGLSKGDKVVVEEKEGELRIKKAIDLVEELAGSLKLPKRYRGMTDEEIIKQAKEEYFKNKYKG